MARSKKNRNDIHGWLILDKPREMTSTEALGRVKRILRPAKAGHAGTLDPLATGLLPLAFGEATKTVPYVMDGRKVYRFTVGWGMETETDDLEGEVSATSDVRPTPDAIGAVLGDFTGTIMQVPPKYSAIKIGGERAYDLARDGEVVELAARPITVHRLTLVGCPDDGHAVFEAECGKGTYVRALARDMGRRLGTCGHVSDLRRVCVGPFDEADMISLEKLETLSHSAAGEPWLASILRPIETALADIPALAVNQADAARLRRGQGVLLRGRDAPAFHGTVYVTESGQLVALAEVERGELLPKRVFNLAAGGSGAIVLEKD